METVKIFIDGIEKDVYGIFYIFNSKYYFIYTEKEIIENDYVALYMTQIGKETQTTPTGLVETGYMVGVEITDPEEQKSVQSSISMIVEDKKNGTTNPQIQYMPMNMLTKLKIVSKKRFRLLKSIVIDNFKLELGEVKKEEGQTQTPANPFVQQVPAAQPVVQPATAEPLAQINILPLNNNQGNLASENSASTPTDIFKSPIPGDTKTENTQQVVQESNVETTASTELDNSVIIDYRTKFFEEEEKNKELQAKIEELTQKLNDIKKVLE